MNMTKHRAAEERKHVLGIQAIGVLSAIEKGEGETIGPGVAAMCRELVAQWDAAHDAAKQAIEEPWERDAEAAESELRG